MNRRIPNGTYGGVRGRELAVNVVRLRILASMMLKIND